MGITEQELATFKLSTGQECRIELNADNTIHVHIGNLRIDMSPREFDNFALIISNARLELHKQKNW